MSNAELVAQRPFLGTYIRKHERALLFVRHGYHNALAMAIGDGIALGIALLGAGVIRMWLFGQPLIPDWWWYLPVAWWFGASVSGLLPSWGLGPVVELRRLTVLNLLVYASAAMLIFLAKEAEDVSRLTVMTSLAISLFTIPLVRIRIKRWLIARDAWGIPAVIYGTGDTAVEIIRQLREERGIGYNPVGIYDDDPEHWGMVIEGVKVLGGTHETKHAAGVAIVSMPNIARNRLIELLEGPLASYRRVIVIPDLLEAPSLWVRPCDLNGVIGIEIAYNLSSPVARFTKRSMDMAIVLAAAPFWVPLCLLMGLLIWLEDRENPIFLQERVGEGGRLFKTWKFRTMVPNAEEVLKRKLEEDPALRYEWETSFKLRVDPRITRIGKFLRRFSVDEIPQLVNVLRGEMSLVGPRPLPIYHHQELNERVQELRTRVRPGLTGLWQISGRSDAGTKGMEQWDPYYVRNWSPWLDIVVLIRTNRIVLQGSGAY